MKAQTNSWAGMSADLLIELPSGRGRGVRERLELGLRDAIQQERLRAGALLPPWRVLAADLGIARSVVVEAYRNLAADGYLETRRGGWTCVRPHRQARRRPIGDAPCGYDAQRFYGWRRPSTASGDPGSRRGSDPALFPRREWLHHYRAALDGLPDPALGDPALGYPDIRGAEPLREALAEYLGRARGAVAPDGVLVCSGFVQGLTLVCRVLRRAVARRAAVEEPCPARHRNAIRASGLEPVPIPLDDRGLDPAALDDVHVDALLVAPAQSYPSGSTLDRDRREALAMWADRRGTLIVEDDYDAELRHDRSPLGALQGLAPERVITIRTTSKTLTPALRLGGLVAPPRLIDPLAREKHDDDLGSSLLEQPTLARLVARGGPRVVSAGSGRSTMRAPTRRSTRSPSCSRARAGAARPLGSTSASRFRHVGEDALVSSAHARGVGVEAGAWHWAGAPPAPSLVVGYGSASDASSRRALRVVGELIERRDG